MAFASPAEALSYVTETANAFMRGPDNDLGMAEPEPAFEMPLFGVSSGADPLWDAYKAGYVGEFHWTPLEAFLMAFPGENVLKEELRVISWILPQTGRTLGDQREEGRLPAERWVKARVLGEKRVNKGLRLHLVAALEKAGIQAVAPQLLPDWTRLECEKYTFASKWSERHAAYAAGLGTFGLCDGLITPAGKAMRTGSVVARLDLPVSERPYASHREYCLHFNSGICGKCVKRCPAGALSKDGHDKRRCKAYIRQVVGPYIIERFAIEPPKGCGFCQVAVPCERGIPPRPKARA